MSHSDLINKPSVNGIKLLEPLIGFIALKNVPRYSCNGLSVIYCRSRAWLGLRSLWLQRLSIMTSSAREQVSKGADTHIVVSAVDIIFFWCIFQTCGHLGSFATSSCLDIHHLWVIMTQKPIIISASKFYLGAQTFGCRADFSQFVCQYLRHINFIVTALWCMEHNNFSSTQKCWLMGYV